MDHAFFIQPDITPADLPVQVFMNHAIGAIHSQGLTTSIYADMNCLGAAIQVVVFKNADFSGHGALRTNRLAAPPDKQDRCDPNTDKSST